MESPTNPEAIDNVSGGGGKKTGIGVGAILAIAALAGFLVWLLVIRDSTESTPTPRGQGAVSVSRGALKAKAGAGQTIYWAGPANNVIYELTNTSNGQVYVRYLPVGEQAGSAKAFLTVGTYAIDAAFATTRAASRKSGSVPVRVGNAGVAFYNKASPTSVYLAYPGSDYQVEVYDPSPARARTLVSSGRITTVAGSPDDGLEPGVPKAVSTTRLRSLVAEQGTPVYWIGTAAGATYELTRTETGVFIRYLPMGVAAGAKTPHLTIGTYPIENAFKVTSVKAKGPGVVRVAAKNGGVAFYSKARPTSVYVAYPDTGVQVEVYDPTPAKARQLVTSGRLKSIG